MQNTFTAKTLEGCLDLASQKLNLKKEEIKYEVLEEKQGIFIKRVTIGAEKKEELNDEKKCVQDNEKEISEKYVQNIEEIHKDINGSVKVKDGKIIVKDPKKDGKPAIIIPGSNVKLLVDDKEITNGVRVYEKNNIEVVFEENVAQRLLNISITHDCMEAYINVKYIPQNVYKLEDEEESESLRLKPSIEHKKYPQVFTKDEIEEALISKGIKAGIITENFHELSELNGKKDLLIAKGIKPIDGIDDKIDIKFQVNNEKKFKEDENGNVDYKSIGWVKEVKEGEVLAIRIKGTQGRDGIDVKGSIKKHKPGKIINIKIGQGCEFKDEDTVISTIEGKPSLKGNVIHVNKVHHIEKDVDITTGNVDFVGDVLIYGSVKEGMKVNCGQNLTINKNIEHAVVYSKQDMQVLGNAINSELYAGGDNIIKLNKLNLLQKLDTRLKELMSTVDHIKKFNLLGKKVRDGEIVKVLLENKFKCVCEISNTFSELLTEGDLEEEKMLSDFIKQKLIGSGPLNIKNINEIHLILIRMEKIIQDMDSQLTIPVTMSINYCQDCIIKSSGDVIITGKGEYISKIISHGNVEFVSGGSIARGGTIKATNEIRCKEVGSEGGVSTKLIVGSKGHIWVDVAYQNTKFKVGEKEYILDTPSKEIHAYLGDNGEITVDKFVL
ncbi:flagellar assembly protein A [Clostridium massiliodielmoense]|uniref:flagellar assembly protein A n=1 Tax=Clostridium massiliodielmoense TaxID=1776385 RepID=UPI00057C7B80|nr:flagellar assembly protein A [Clostridium massiliodielmoense]